MFWQSETSNLTLKFRGYLWEKGNVKETSISYSTLNICVFTIRQYWSLIERIAITKESSTFKGKRVCLHKIYVYLTFNNKLMFLLMCSKVGGLHNNDDVTGYLCPLVILAP